MSVKYGLSISTREGIKITRLSIEQLKYFNKTFSRYSEEISLDYPELWYVYECKIADGPGSFEENYFFFADDEQITYEEFSAQVEKMSNQIEDLAISILEKLKVDIYNSIPLAS